MTRGHKTAAATIRWSAEELNSIEERAKALSRTRSEYIRMRVLADPTGPSHDPVDFEQVMENILGAQEQFRDETLREVKLQLTLLRQEVGDLFDALMNKLEADRARDSTRH